MQYTKKLVIVCAGKDTKRAIQHNIKLLQLCIGVGKNMTLKRLYIPAKTKNDILGISDMGITNGNINACADAIIYEVVNNKFSGIFADFERDDKAVLSLASKLDELCKKYNIDFFVPVQCSCAVIHACIVVQSALSGGILEEYINKICEDYPNRTAVSIRPVSTDFTLPAQKSEGNPISKSQRQLLIQKYSSGVFFSRELCAKYFTYMDELERGHFVLFDDESTIFAKLERLNALNIKNIFAVYPDIYPIIKG